MKENIAKVPQMRSINQIADEFSVARYFVRGVVQKGKIPFVKSGKKVLISVEKFAEFLMHGENA